MTPPNSSRRHLSRERPSYPRRSASSIIKIGDDDRTLTGHAGHLPNECWQADFTHFRLTRHDGRPGSNVEILSWLDDGSRYALSVTVHHRVTGPSVVATFRDAVHQFGVPASTLTDNGMVCTTRFSGGKGGRNGFEPELRRLKVRQKNSRLNYPTTMPRLPRATGTETTRALQRLGFKVIRQRGSHVALCHAGRGVTVFVPVHAGEPLATGPLRAVLRQGGVSVEEFAPPAL